MNAIVGIPPAAIVRTLSRFDRDQLAGFIAVAIDLLDFADGDPDFEEDDPPEPDDHAGQCDEDGVNTTLDVLFTRPGAGCVISDDDVSIDHYAEPI